MVGKNIFEVWVMVQEEPKRLIKVLRRIGQKKDTWFTLDDDKRLTYLEGCFDMLKACP